MNFSGKGIPETLVLKGWKKVFCIFIILHRFHKLAQICIRKISLKSKKREFHKQKKELIAQLFSIKYIFENYPANASAPPTISKISFVIAA